MNKITTILNNEKGATMIVAILILALLTVIGISATSTSTTELQIAANDQLHKIAFVTAESGWEVGVNWLNSQYPLITRNCGLDTSGGDIDFSAANYNSPDNFALGATNSYAVDIEFIDVQYAEGYTTEFMRHNYEVSSSGSGPRGAEARVEISSWKIGHVGGY